MTELCFDILCDLTDHLKGRDYFEFLNINELSIEISLCNIVRCAEWYFDKYKYYRDGHYSMLNEICDDNEFAVFKWFHYNHKKILNDNHYVNACGYAVKHNRCDVVEWLCSLDTKYDKIAINTSARLGNLPILKWLHERGSFEKSDGYTIYQRGYDQRDDPWSHKYIIDALNEACFCGCIEIIKWLFDLGIQTSYNGFKGIEYACRNRQWDVVVWLHNEYPKLVRCSVSALLDAIKKDRPDIAEYLYSEHQDIRTVRNMVKLAHDACSDCHLMALEFAFTKLIMLSPYDNERETRAFVKNKVTGHIIKQVGIHHWGRNGILDFLCGEYGFRDPR